MGTMTDPTIDSVDRHIKADDEAVSIDAGQVYPERPGSPAKDQILQDGANGVHSPVKSNKANATESTASAANGYGGSVDIGKMSMKPSPVQTHIRRGGSEGLYRGASGGIHRGASGGTHIHRGVSGGILRGQSGGIYRGRSGGIHLPSLPSISFPMSRLPEDDAGVMMHFTETKEMDTTPESSRESDEDAPPPKKKHRLRKHLTAIGAFSFAFRFSEAVLSLIVIVVICSTRESIRTDGVDFGTLKFNHFQAYRYLVAVNVIVFVYSTFQFIQLLYTVILGISFIPSIFISTWLTFVLDQLFSYLLLSASTSAATVANISYTGEMGIQLCSRFDVGSFCSKADAAVAMSFFTFLTMLSSTILAIYRIAVLLREY